jgi:hypothetical protein
MIVPHHPIIFLMKPNQIEFLKKHATNQEMEVQKERTVVEQKS